MSFFTFLSRPYHLEITIMVREKNLKKKNKDIHNASLPCINESMLKNLILFCEIWVLTPSFFDTPLRPQYPIFIPKIKLENCLTYCSMIIQNYLCDKLVFSFLDFFNSQYPLLFVDSILQTLENIGLKYSTYSKYNFVTSLHVRHDVKRFIISQATTMTTGSKKMQFFSIISFSIV